MGLRHTGAQTTATTTGTQAGANPNPNPNPNPNQGCGFVATRNAFRRDGQEGGRDVARSLNFDQQFTTSQGLVPSLHVKSRDLVKKVEGFRIAVHVDWPRRRLYFSIAGGACRSNPHPNPHPNPHSKSILKVCVILILKQPSPSPLPPL